MSKENGWIGVDLDGTLAYYDEWKGVGIIGDPIPVMVQRVKQWLSEGKTVKIMTARVGGPDEAMNQAERQAVQDYTRQLFGQALEVTCKKNYEMEELWDDRAVRVVKNTGLVSDGSDVEDIPLEPGDIGACI